MIPAVHVQLTGGTGWVITAAIVVMVVLLAVLGVHIYVTQAILEDWDSTRNDADLGARGVEQLTEHLADLREEMTAAMLHHCERLDGIDERLDELRDRLPVKVESVRTDTDIAAAVLVGHWADGLEQRPTPHKRARTTEGETTDA